MTQEVSTQEILDKIAKDEDLTGEEIQRITHTDVKFRIQEELGKYQPNLEVKEADADASLKR